MPEFVQHPDLTRATAMESGLIIVGFFALFVFVALRKRDGVRWASVVTQLGMLTYPLYLLHNIAKVVLLRPLGVFNRHLALFVAIAFSLSLSAVLATTVDRHWRPRFQRALLDLLRQWGSRRLNTG